MLAKLQVDYYVLRILLMTLGTVITASGAGMIVSYDAITFSGGGRMSGSLGSAENTPSHLCGMALMSSQLLFPWA